MKKGLPALCILIVFISISCSIGIPQEKPITSPTKLPLSATSKPTMALEPSPTSRPTQTARPRPTATRKPNTATPIPPTPVPAEVSFDPSNANPVLPADVLQEVTYFPGGGGEGWGCPDSFRSQPNFLDPPSQAEWLNRIEIRMCGWQPNEVISVNVIYRGSTYLTTAVQASGDGTTSYILSITDSMQPGDWSFIMDAPSGHLETSVNVYLPSAPRMYSLDHAKLILFGFSPNETIRLIAYYIENRGSTTVIRFLGWEQFDVDLSGMLIIDIPDDPSMRYYAVSNTSGLVEDSGLLPEEGNAATSIISASCGGPPSNLWVGASARVSTTEGSTMRIRANPGFSQEILAQVSEGTLVTILRGPQCADKSNWWFIQTESGQEGWMVEYQDGLYLLQPVKP